MVYLTKYRETKTSFYTFLGKHVIRKAASYFTMKSNNS